MPAFIADLVLHGSRELQAELGLTPDQANRCMRRVARAFCFANGKSTVYVTDAAALDREMRNADIVLKYAQDEPPPGGASKRFTGARVRELAAQHNLTEQRIFAILADARNAEVLADRSADEATSGASLMDPAAAPPALRPRPRPALAHMALTLGAE